MDGNQLREEIKKYEFYHVIQLEENISTPGCQEFVEVQNVPLRALRALDVKDKRVLDIGCRDGLFCFEAENLGAREVIGIDNNLSLGAVNLLIPYFQSKVKMYEVNLMDLKPETFGLFDIVVFPGVLYHLRYPFWALKLIKDILHEGGQLIIETAVYRDDNRQAMLFCPTGSESPYEETSCTFFNMKGLTDTLSSLGLVVQQTEVLKTQDGLNYTNLLARLKSRLGILKSVMPSIDRATVVCRKQSPAEPTSVNKYWHGTHKFHTHFEW